MSKTDSIGDSITEAGDGLIRVDGITVFRKIVRGDIIFIQFCDHDRLRSKCRGSKFFEVPLNILLEKLETKADEQQQSV